MEIAIAMLTMVLGVIVPIWLHRRAHPPRELRYRVNTQALLNATLPPGADLSLRVHGQEVHDPRVVSVRLWSIGRADVPSTAFDAGRPLTVDLGAPIVPGSFVVERPTDAPNFAQLSAQEIGVGPALLPRTFDASFQVVTATTPNVVLRSPLIDIRVAPVNVVERQQIETSQIQRERKRNRFTPLRVFLGITIAAAAVLIVSLILYQIDTNLSAAVGGVALLTLMVCAAAFIILALIRIFRLLQEIARRPSR